MPATASVKNLVNILGAGVSTRVSAFKKLLDAIRADTGGLYIGSATSDPANLEDGAGVTTTVTVTGAALGDFASASFSNDLQGVLLTAWVSAANTVSVRFQNETAGAVDLASGTLRASVIPATRNLAD